MCGNGVCIMASRMAPTDYRRGIRVVGALGAAQTNCTRVALSIDLFGGCDVWCGRFANLKCNCKCDCKWCCSVYVLCCRDCCVCLGRYAMSARYGQCGLWYLLRVFHFIVFLDCCKRLFV